MIPVKPRQRRKTPLSGSEAFPSVRFSEDTWIELENRLGRPISCACRKNLESAAVNFRMDLSVERTWPQIEPILKKLKDVQRATNLIFNMTLPNEHDLAVIALAAGQNAKQTRQLIGLQRHLAKLSVATHKFRKRLQDLKFEAESKFDVTVSMSLPVRTGQKTRKPKFRLLLRLKRALFPLEDALPSSTRSRKPGEGGPLGGRTFHSSPLAKFLVVFLQNIPDSKIAITEAKAGDLIRRFNDEMKSRKERGIVERDF